MNRLGCGTGLGFQSFRCLLAQSSIFVLPCWKGATVSLRYLSGKVFGRTLLRLACFHATSYILSCQGWRRGSNLVEYGTVFCTHQESPEFAIVDSDPEVLAQVFALVWVACFQWSGPGPMSFRSRCCWVSVGMCSQRRVTKTHVPFNVNRHTCKCIFGSCSCFSSSHLLLSASPILEALVGSTYKHLCRNLRLRRHALWL